MRRHGAVGFIEASGAASLLKGLLLAAVAAVAVFASGGTANAAKFVGPPTVSNVLSGSAHVSVEVDTEGEEVTVNLSKQAYPLNPQGYTFVEVFAVQPSPDPVVVSWDITGLRASTKYAARFDSNESTSVDFTTLPAQAPVAVSLGAPSELTNTTALVPGEVERPAGSDPGFDVACKVEYISDAHYMQTQNEQQEYRIGIPEGTYTLVGFEGDETAPLPVDATVAEFQAALETLPSIGPSAVTVSGSVGNYRTYLIEFIGPLSNQNVPDVGLNASGLIGGGELSSRTVQEGRSQGYQDADSSPCTPNPVTSAGISTITARLDGLTPNTSYHYRLVATNAGGTDLLEAASLFVTKAAPVAQTLGVNGLGATAATLGGQVSASNSPEVTYQFEWGATPAYGHLAPATAAALPFTDNSFHAVGAQIGGLEPATEYHYRVVATNTQTGEADQGRDRTFVTLPAVGPTVCPNESSRIGPSAGLPDCRAFEMATPNLNNTNSFTTGLPIRSRPDGTGLLFFTFDAPGEAKASTINQPVVSRRGSDGWHTRSLGALSPEPAETFASIAAEGLVSPDFTESVFYSSTPMGTDRSAGELNLYLRKPDDSVVPISDHGPTLPEPPGGEVVQFPYSVGEARASEDFSHIFFTSHISQVDGYPETFSTYGWTEAGGVEPLGILPAEGSTPETPAPSGVRVVEGSLPASSRDGSKVLFETLDPFIGTPEPPLYLRIDGEETVNVTASERSSPEPGPAKNVGVVGITADGSKVLFTSSSQLTDDANTGEVGNGGVRNGADLYSYDVASRTLTDLTVDEDPEDASTGAGVTYLSNLGAGEGINSMPYASKDGSSIYFIAEGHLAPGAAETGPSLYVLRDGEIRFVAPATGMNGGGKVRGFYATPDGRHALITSTENLTGYESGGEAEVYKYTYGTGSIECASCRPGGSLPAGSALFEERGISDDGSRVFFTSTDAVLPGLTSGLERAYEYTNGKVSLLSPADAQLPVRAVTASASGDDVFLRTYEELIPGAGHSFAIYDARVNADTFVPAGSQCQGESCRGTGTSAPGGAATGSAQFQAPGEVVAPRSKAVRGRKAKLRINLPDGGQLQVTGKGIKTVKKKVPRAGAVTVVVTLNGSANKKRLKKGAFKTRARVQFTPQAGASAGSAQVRTVVSLTFRGPSKKRGGK